MTDDITKLARAFSERLMDSDLGVSQLLQAVEDNRSETHPGICHTHDERDPNMEMAAAFEHVTGRAPRSDSDDDCALWNAAWDLAKREEFYLTDIDRLAGLGGIIEDGCTLEYPGFLQIAVGEHYMRITMNGTAFDCGLYTADDIEKCLDRIDVPTIQGVHDLIHDWEQWTSHNAPAAGGLAYPY